MNRVAGVAVVLAFIAATLAGAEVASATPADGAWQFTGSMSAPSRSQSNVDISVSGSIEVTSGLLSSVSATKSCDDTHPPQVIPSVQNTGSNAFTPVTNGGLLLTPISSAGTTPVSGTANVSPGTYSLVLRFRCTGDASWDGNVASSPPTSVSIATLSLTVYTTRACIATTPVTACTSLNPQAPTIPSGLSATFAGIIKRTWSDGVVTEAPVDGSPTLKRADVGSGNWSTLASGCDYTGIITATFQYRCESTYGQHDPVTVTAMSPTGEYLIGSPSLNPPIGVKGTVVTVSGILHQKYPDSSTWPAPVGTSYAVQFRQGSTASWSTVASDSLKIRGNYSSTFALPGTGAIRITVGGQPSAEAAITELTSTATYEISDVSVPANVAPSSTTVMSATVRAQWSDGSWRSATDGTPAALEFSPSFDPGTTPGTWRVVKTGSTLAGAASFSVVPQASGFWRIRVDSTLSRHAFVGVTGSSPLALTATMTPSAGQVPFAGESSSYDVSARLSGYVGTETVSLYVALGPGNFVKAGAVTSGNFRGQLRLASPSSSGSYVPRFEARNSAGDVLATATGAATIVVDGIKTYEIVARASDGTVREGFNGRITASLSGVTDSGGRIDQTWSGIVQLQRNLDGDWATIDSQKASGDTLNFSTPAISQAAYRIVWVGHDTISNDVRFSVITPTGTARFGRISADDNRIVKGESTRLYAILLEQYSDQKYYPAAAGREVLLQVFTGSSWETSKKVYTQAGSVSVSVSPGRSTQYRFVHATAGTSKSLSVTVVEPQADHLDVDWPDTYYKDQGARFTVAIKTSTGAIWTGSTTLYLQYRFSTYEPWKTLNTKAYRGERVRMEWGPGTYYTVYFKLTAPDLGLASQVSYS